MQWKDHGLNKSWKKLPKFTILTQWCHGLLFHLEDIPVVPRKKPGNGCKELTYQFLFFCN